MSLFLDLELHVWPGIKGHLFEIYAHAQTDNIICCVSRMQKGVLGEASLKEA